MCSENSGHMPEAIDAMERAFIQLAQQEATLPLRNAIPVGKNGLTLSMPAYLSKEKILGLKLEDLQPHAHINAIGSHHSSIRI